MSSSRQDGSPQASVNGHLTCTSTTLMATSLLAVLAFSLTFNGNSWPHDTAFVSLLPGATMVFRATGGPAGKYAMKADRGSVVQTSPTRWNWTAPATPGTYALRFTGPERSIDVHAFVLVPASRVKNGVLNGYAIGAYPAPRGRYQPPPGFIEVTKENDDTKLSPHFRLKQFLCKQQPLDRFPQYAIVQEELVLKLEAVLTRVRSLGFNAGTLHVMSGYRTPSYNAAIGDVPYSMHQWGSAADVFVDTSHPDRMDDLNGDDRVDLADAKLLYDEIDRLVLPAGGLGYYPATAAHPPFVHIDARGVKARWKG